MKPYEYYIDAPSMPRYAHGYDAKKRWDRKKECNEGLEIYNII